MALLVTFNQAIYGILKSNQKARQNPKALAQLDGLQVRAGEQLDWKSSTFGFEKTAKVETLQEIIAEMSEMGTIPLRLAQNKRPKRTVDMR